MVFSALTFLVAIPTAIKVFNWLGTLWGSRIRLSTAMLNALGFVSMFIIGGLSGIWMAATPVDIYIHDTYIVVAHFHYVVFGGSVFAIFAGIYHWFPKMFGRVMNETLGKIHFVGSFVFTNGVFYMMHQLGMAGLMRRTADPYAYETYAHLQPLNEFISICAFCLFLWQGIFIFNILGTGSRSGALAYIVGVTAVFFLCPVKNRLMKASVAERTTTLRTIGSPSFRYESRFQPDSDTLPVLVRVAKL